MKLENKLLNRAFSHIYIEEEAKNYEMTKRILEKFENSKKIYIDNYKEVFSRNNQNFILQKQTPKLILAIKRDNFLYKGAKVCESFGNSNFYYISSVLNCIYDCEYCYLQGVYSSANIVIFVNIEDMFEEVKEEMRKIDDMYICISYDTDLLAMENILGMASKWYNFIKEHKNIKIELRTKSSNIKSLKNLEPNSNYIVAWTFSPDEIINSFENKTSRLNMRIKALQELTEIGFTIRICFDPVIKVKNFEKIYGKMIEKVFEKISGEKILDVSIGTFRISKDYIKRMKKNRGNSKLLYYPFICKNGVYSYSDKDIEDMIKFMKDKVLEYIEKDKVFI